MTLATPTIELTTTASPEKSERDELRRFARISAGFLVGLVVAAIALNLAAGSYLHLTSQRGGLGSEVQIAVERVQKEPETVQVIFLGDSVARQLFRPNTEPGKNIRFMTTNQAITMAGQCYLAEGAMNRCRHISDIYLFYLPQAWRNDMPRAFTHDYLCGHFHTLPQVIEVFKVKRDCELLFVHLGRWAIPNVMAVNSLSRPGFAMEPDVRQTATDSAGSAPPVDPEQLLTLLSGLIGPTPTAIPPEPQGRQAVFLSTVSRYYLSKLRDDCRSRGIRLHVLPCPVSAENSQIEFVDEGHVYDVPMIQDIPAGQLIDHVHFKRPYVEATRERMIRYYGLDFLRVP